MRYFLVSEEDIKSLARRAKPIDLTLSGRREWKNLIARLRNFPIPEGTSYIRCHGQNREANAAVRDIILPVTEEF